MKDRLRLLHYAGRYSFHIVASVVLMACVGAAQSLFVLLIQPIFDRSCVKCHGGDKPRGEFSLASRELMLKGGQSHEPAIVPGYADDSPMIHFTSVKVEDLEMPPLNRKQLRAQRVVRGSRLQQPAGLAPLLSSPLFSKEATQRKAKR